MRNTNRRWETKGTLSILFRVRSVGVSGRGRTLLPEWVPTFAWKSVLWKSFSSIGTTRSLSASLHRVDNIYSNKTKILVGITRRFFLINYYKRHFSKVSIWVWYPDKIFYFLRYPILSLNLPRRGDYNDHYISPRWFWCATKQMFHGKGRY